jgi:GDP-4-dehydro-6-deoxy-D-mannose reductase
VRILVTGSSGFVGQHLCRYLTSIGDEVIPCPGPDGDGAVDVTDEQAVRLRVSTARPEGVIHLAGVSSVAWSHANPTKTFLTNGLGTVNILQGVREGAPAARVLLVGSGEVYGRTSEGHRSNEDDTPRPLSPYAASKLAGETIARQYAASYGIQVVFARPFNHLGPGQAAHFVVPSFARQIAEVKRGKREAVIEVGDVSPVRDFLHVEDVVRGYRLLLESADVGTPYNLCSGTGRTILSLLDELLALALVKAEVRIDSARLRPSEIPWLVGDPSRINALGWQVVRPISQALSEVLREFGA